MASRKLKRLGKIWQEGKRERERVVQKKKKQRFRREESKAGRRPDKQRVKWKGL